MTDKLKRRRFLGLLASAPMLGFIGRALGSRSPQRKEEPAEAIIFNAGDRAILANTDGTVSMIMFTGATDEGFPKIMEIARSCQPFPASANLRDGWGDGEIRVIA